MNILNSLSQQQQQDRYHWLAFQQGKERLEIESLFSCFLMHSSDKADQPNYWATLLSFSELLGKNIVSLECFSAG